MTNSIPQGAIQCTNPECPRAFHYGVMGCPLASSGSASVTNIQSVASGLPPADADDDFPEDFVGRRIALHDGGVEEGVQIGAVGVVPLSYANSRVIDIPTGHIIAGGPWMEMREFARIVHEASLNYDVDEWYDSQSGVIPDWRRDVVHSVATPRNLGYARAMPSSHEPGGSRWSSADRTHIRSEVESFRTVVPSCPITGSSIRHGGDGVALIGPSLMVQGIVCRDALLDARKDVEALASSTSSWLWDASHSR